MAELTPWRSDSRLAGKFHPDYPDDLQVVVHAGGPRLSSLQPELVWVRFNGVERDVYQGSLLNQPHQLPSLKAGDSILVMPTTKDHPPIMVTPKYLKERSAWHITACNKCGMPELFDAPSDLQAKLFPNVPEGSVMESFTSFCPLCGGVQMVSSPSFAATQQ